MSTQITKTAIICRAVPGSGKTSITRHITDKLTSEGVDFQVCSTDSFFMTSSDNHYHFDIKALYGNHQKNLAKFKKALEDGIPVVICDNVNICPWQTEPYTQAARQFGYQVLLLTFEPRELKAHIKSQKVTPEKPDAHGVPTDVLIRFIREYWQYNSLLDRAMPVDPKLQHDFRWDEKACRRVETEEPAHHFDYDKIIIILPHEYRAVGRTIGRTVFKLMQPFDLINATKPPLKS